MEEAGSHRGSSTPLAGLRALDVGCGGGLLSEVRCRRLPLIDFAKMGGGEEIECS